MEFDKYQNYLGTELNCNFCGGKNLIEWGRRGIFKADQCKDCGLVFINPRLTSEGLSKFYADYFQKRQNDIELAKKRQTMYELDRDFVLKHFAKHQTILDVGCGGGEFLNCFPNEYTKLGTEYNEVAAQEARQKAGIKCYVGDITEVQIDESDIDLIILRGVLEHTTDPKRALIKLSKMLAKDGLLYITATPNLNSVCAELYRSQWNLFGPCDHLYYFNEELISNLLRDRGLSLIDEHYFYAETPYADIKKDTQQIIEDLQRLRKGLPAERMSPPFYGNMMTLIYKKD